MSSNGKSCLLLLHRQKKKQKIFELPRAEIKNNPSNGQTE